MLRWLGPGATTAGLLYAVYLFFVGGFDFASLDGFFSSETAAFEGEPVNLSQETERSQELIRIATFNIEAFGEKKSQTRNHPKTEIDVMGEIAKIVARFDLVAIQEVMSDGISIDRLVKLLNESGGTYAAVVSDPIGDEHRKESYAFIWDRRQIEIVPGSSYIVLDPEDRMYREPMVASFRTLVSQESTGVPFRFTAINVHTDPDEVD
ncbi:MAG: deoxyribonuclease, partial [Planctomycetota bacterium]